MTTLMQRVKQEITYWTQSTWSFADVETHYDALAADYDEINENAHSHFRRFTDTLRLARIPDDAYVLDICSRTGIGTAYFYEQGKVGSAVCADVSQEMGKRCAERLESVGFREYRWVQICGPHWPFADGEFDVTISLETVEHFPRPDQFIRELGRVTRPGGTLILSTPNVLWEPMHALAAITGLHHSEGPHRFVPHRKLRHLISRAGFQLDHAETTVLIPAGPDWLIGAGQWLESRMKNSLMPLVGLRHIFICRKLP